MVANASPYKLAGAKLKALRKFKGFTQREVSTKIGITEGFLSFLETGTKQGSLDTYIALAQIYGTPLHSLFNDGLPAPKTDTDSIQVGGLRPAQKRLIQLLVREMRNLKMTGVGKGL